jgi:hypothetical protein
MIKGLSSVFGSTDKNLEILHHLFLTGKTVESRGTQSALYIFLLRRDTATFQIVIHDAKIHFFLELTK